MSKALFALQSAKKVVSDSSGLVDITTGLVNSVLNLPDGQLKFFGKSNCIRTVINSAHQFFFRLVKITLGHYMLPKLAIFKL